MTTSQRRGPLAAAQEPAPVGAEAVDALLAAARRGDAEALGEICLRYRPLVRSVVAASRRLPAGVEAGDVEQEAYRQVCEAVRRYDPSRGVSLAAFLSSQVKWRVANYLRSEARRAGSRPLTAEALEIASDEAVGASGPEVSPRLARVLRRLSPRQRAVIAGLYWRERTAGELARELAVSPQAVAALRRRAEGSLRRQLSGPGTARPSRG